MKTISRLCRRCVCAAFAIVLLIFAVNAAAFIGLCFRFVSDESAGSLRGGLRTFSGRFIAGEDGRPVPEADALSDVSACAWVMLLGDEGDVLWSLRLPDALNHRYTVGQVAAFSRWYLEDYPVFVYRNDYGLAVFGMPEGSVTRFNLFLDSPVLHALLSSFCPLLLTDAALILVACLLLGWGFARALRSVGHGVESLSHGEPVTVPERGITAELAHQLNETGRLLSRQQAEIARRDSARTSWIAGVSHDIRTPLSVIVISAERIARQSAPEGDAHLQAGRILTQAQRIGSLIEDLNLTSKLRYDAQPLRLSTIPAGTLLRQAVASFCSSPAGEQCRLSFELEEAAGRAPLTADIALLRRALDNLLINCARHAGPGCAVTVRARLLPTPQAAVEITVADDGPGYPAPVLACLRGETPAGAPHVLGLHLVAQILAAHGGSARFESDGGAIATLLCPLSPPAAAVGQT